MADTDGHIAELTVRHFAWRNHAPLVTGREVVVSATAKEAEGGWRVALIEQTVDDGTSVASGQAFVVDDR